MAMPARLEDQLKQLPAKPGVYLFRDEKGGVLYVGKAKTLRPRVRSYFQRGQDGRAQIAYLPDRVADIEVSGCLVLRPVREREEGARDARRPEPGLPVPPL
jgi:excinuclease UvrABC nuclease subunit